MLRRIQPPRIMPSERTPHFPRDDSKHGKLERLLSHTDRTTRVEITVPDGVGKTQMVIDHVEQYIYDPLPTVRSIRLLSFENVADLSLRLKAFSVPKLPQYKALSYTWGKATCEESSDNQNNNPPAIYHIKINNKVFGVSENLYDALQQLRTEDVGYLWVDAICINQIDPEERASQVLLMGDIYSDAERVIVWLGKDDSDLEAMIWLQDILAPIWTVAQEQIDRMDYRLAALLEISAGELARRLGSVKRFFKRRRWFRRAWIIQETVLAKGIELRNGKVRLKWDIIVFVTHNAATTTPLAAGHMEALRFCRDLVQKGSLIGPDPKFPELQSRRYMWFLNYYRVIVRFLMEFETTCEHDKIYAGLGMAEKILGPGPTLPIVPDYKKHWTDVFVSFTILILQELPSIQLIANFQNRVERENSLPSWCPDYRLPSCSSLTHWTVFTLNCELWSASGSLDGLKPVSIINEKVLSVNGKLLDIITEFTPQSSAMLDPHSSFDICSRLSPTYLMTQQDRVEVLWRTMLNDFYVDALAEKSLLHPAPADLAECFSNHILFLEAKKLHYLTSGQGNPSEYEGFLEELEFRERNFESSSVQLPSRQKILDTAQHFSDTVANGSPMVSAMFSMVDKVTRFTKGSSSGAHYLGQNRSLFRTLKRNLLGLGPDKMEAGDEIWLLKGAYTPFVLRPQRSGQYVVVGESYVHGVMHGEWLEQPGGADGFGPVELI